MRQERAYIRSILVGLLVSAIAAPMAACQPAPADLPPETAEAELAADAVPVAWEPPVEIASGDAYRGPWRMNESVFDFVDDPTVAMNDAGYVGVAWADHPQQDIFFQLYGPDNEPRLDEPVNVSRSPGIFSWLPRMVVTDGNEPDVYLLWQDIVFYPESSHGGEIIFARSTDGGSSFDAPINLSDTVAGAGKGRLTARRWHNGSFDIAVGPDGGIYAAWTEYEGALWFSRSIDGGGEFSEPQRLAGAEGENPARGPSIAVDHEGAVYIAWTIGEDGAADIRYAVSRDGGESFGEPRVVHESEGHSDAPKLAFDPGGTLHLAYAESPTGPFAAYHILYARMDADNGAFEEPSALPAADGGDAWSGFPSLSVDGAGAVYLLWEHYPAPRDRPQGLAFAVSRDGGDSFTRPVVAPGSAEPEGAFNGSQQGLLMRKLAVNTGGALAVVNSTFKSNESSHIWLIRGALETGEE